MTDAWKVVGRAIAARRQWIGLDQEDLKLYGGPGKSTVGKIEHGRMDPFTVASQQKTERVLGWSRGTIREMHRAIEKFGDDEALWSDYVDLEPPDLARLRVADETSEGELAAISDVALVGEIGRRLARAREIIEESSNGNTPSNNRAADGRTRVTGQDSATEREPTLGHSSVKPLPKI